MLEILVKKIPGIVNNVNMKKMTVMAILFLICSGEKSWSKGRHHSSDPCHTSEHRKYVLFLVKALEWLHVEIIIKGLFNAVLL